VEAILWLDIVDVIEERRIGKQFDVPIDPGDGILEELLRCAAPLLLRQNGS
jgi:hypothetical protein